jgi:hypothetical protein
MGAMYFSAAQEAILKEALDVFAKALATSSDEKDKAKQAEAQKLHDNLFK